MALPLSRTVGTHVLMNVYDVPHPEVLVSLEAGRPILDHIVRELQLHVMNEAGHAFTPHGYSYAYVLSESHFTIHTYPEYQSCYIDIFCCSPTFDTARAIRAVQRGFHTENVQYQVIPR